MSRVSRWTTCAIEADTNEDEWGVFVERVYICHQSLSLSLSLTLSLSLSLSLSLTLSLSFSLSLSLTHLFHHLLKGAA